MSKLEQMQLLLKKKWLDYYAKNRLWINEMFDVTDGWIETYDGRRPQGLFILGVISALEPRLYELLLPFCKLNPIDESLITVMGLDFDPDLVLELMQEDSINDQKSS